MKPILLDLNYGPFQDDLLALSPEETARVFASLRKIRRLTWDQLYSDRGFHWEAIHSQTGPHGGRVYSLRITKRYRAGAYRDGDWLRLVSIHLDHDSAYQ